MGPNGGATQYGFTAATTGTNYFTAPNSSYSAGATVVLFDGAGSTIPTNMAVGTVYYVVGSPSGGTFNLAASSGGSAIVPAQASAGIVQAITIETFTGSGGTFTVSQETLSMF